MRKTGDPCHPPLTPAACSSAIPMPNPRLERKKKLLVYDPAMHDYTQEAPQWRELRPSHWVLCSEQEAKDWLAEM